ncbi:hypothetical protein Tco_0086380 [Tanacetum coccineum]
MVWRHPNATNDDPLPAAGSFSMADMRRLSAHGADGNVMGIHDFLYLPEWTSAEVEEEPHLNVRSTLKKLPFYCTPPTIADVVILDPTPEDLAVGTPSSKILAKAEASQKRKASTFGTTLSHVAKRTRDGDDNALYEIPLVTSLCTAAVIPSLGNQGRSSNAHTAEDSLGKGIMADDVAAPFIGASRPRPSSGPVPSFRDVSGDVIHADFFPFFVGPYYATYPQDGIIGLRFSPPECGCSERVYWCGLWTKHQVLKPDEHIFGLNDKLVSSNSSFAKSKAKGKERKKKIKSLTKSLDNLHAEVACLSAALN